MQLIAKRYDTGEPVCLELAGNVIQSLQPLAASEAARATRLPWLSPGFVDLQVNGYGGREFTDAELSSQDVYRISVALDASGVVQYCPTVTTHSDERITKALAILARACEEFPDVAARVLGFHVEGPYISPVDGPRGAHPREHCREPNWDEFQRWQAAAGGRIRIITLSPEYDTAPDFIRRAASSGVTVAIGHTQATSEQIRAAVDAGARFSTHLGNGAHAVLPRHPNYIWDQLAEDRLGASLIVDGHHLPPAVVKTFVRAKGAERCLLVSDITGVAGMPPGRYKTGLGEVEVLESGRLVVAGQRQYLAGAALPIGVGIANVMRYAGVDLKTAVEMATLRPLQLTAAPILPDPFAIGSPATFVLFDLPLDCQGLPTGDFAIRGLVREGKLMFGAT